MPFWPQTPLGVTWIEELLLTSLWKEKAERLEELLLHDPKSDWQPVPQ